MWMAYIEEIEVKDFKSAVENIRQTFSNLAFDAHHEAVYGMGAFLQPEECIKLGHRYDAGRDACDDLLDSEIGLIEWYNILKNNNLDNYCYDIKQHLPTAFCEIYLKDEIKPTDYDWHISDEDDDDDEDSEGEEEDNEQDQ